jgi:hypothetical protein
MRIIYEKSIERYKVTGFASAGRYSIKIESPYIETIYKLPEHDLLDSPEKAQQFFEQYWMKKGIEELRQLESNLGIAFGKFIDKGLNEPEFV